MGPKTTGVAKSTGVLSALVVLGLEPAARANDVSDELTVGELSSSTYGTNSPYMSDRLGGSVDPSEKLSLSLDATFTRYFKENRVPAENIFQFAVAGDYDVDDHWSFGIDARGSPPSTAVMSTPAG